METDIWGQLALEASSVYVTDGANVKRPLCDTVFSKHILNLAEIKSLFVVDIYRYHTIFMSFLAF